MLPETASLKVVTETPPLEPATAWPEPLPLFRSPEESAPFPLEALGVLEGVVRETLRIVQAPDALVAGSYLAAASYAAQGLANLALDGRVYPLSLFLLTVAESGERKTSVDVVASGPIRERQRMLHLAQQDEISRWEGQMLVWESERKGILTKKGRAQHEKKAELDALGSPPPKPWGGILLTTEPTYEGLIRLLAEGWPSAALFSNEGGEFLGGYAMGKEHKLRTIAGLSKLWDATQEPDRVRGGDGASLLYNRRLALHLMAQPEVARVLLGNQLTQGQGFLTRMLTAAPASTVGTRRYVAEAVEDTAAFKGYARLLHDALERVEQQVLGDDDSKRQGLRLPAIGLTAAAKNQWVGFYDYVEGNQNSELAPIRGFASKLAEHALRLAGVLALLENPDVKSVDEDAITRGIILAEYYAIEALRLTGNYRIPPELVLASDVLAWILDHCKDKGRRVFHLAEVYRLGPPAVRSAAAARETICTLEAHHYLARCPNTEVDGVKRADVWGVSPHALP
jgi:hypothetical protein